MKIAPFKGDKMNCCVLTTQPGHVAVNRVASTVWPWLLALLVSLCLTACGGGGGGGPSAPPVQGPPQPTSITFNDIDGSIAPGSQLFVRATARFADGSAYEITTMATWRTSNALIATVTSGGGVVQGLADGEVDITVTFRDFSAVKRVRVGRFLTHIEINTRQGLALGVGAEYAYDAVGHYTHGSFDISTGAAWQSSDPSIARMRTESGRGNTVVAMAPGVVTITATKDGVSQQVSLRVLPIRSLDAGSMTLFPSKAEIARDGSGRVMAVWAYSLPTDESGDLAYALYDPVTGWSGKRPIRSNGGFATRPYAPSLAMNAAGSALVAWIQYDGIYAARYLPGTGWRSPVKVAEVTTSGLPPKVTACLDAGGNGMLVWTTAEPRAPRLMESRFTEASGLWTAPAEVPGTQGTTEMAHFDALNMSPSGVAMLSWWRKQSLVSGVFQRAVSRYEPGSGWSAPVPLDTVGASIDKVATAINDNGDFVIGWLFGESVHIRRYVVGSGWRSLQQVAAPSARLPRDLRLALNIAGAAVLTWWSAWDEGVVAAYMGSTGEWETPRDLYSAVINRTGNPELLQPFMTDDGRALISWRLDSLDVISNLATARYVPGTGWETAVASPYVGRHMVAYEVAVVHGRDGKGAAVWRESNGSTFNFYADPGLGF